jgi:hypothetical protein
MSVYFCLNEDVEVDKTNPKVISVWKKPNKFYHVYFRSSSSWGKEKLLLTEVYHRKVKLEIKQGHDMSSAFYVKSDKTQIGNKKSI